MILIQLLLSFKIWIKVYWQLIDQLSTTVGTPGHNTGLGWSESIKEHQIASKFSQIKVIDDPTYKYENKFFPCRNITSKIMHVQGISRKGNRRQLDKFAPKGYVIEKENKSNNLLVANLPAHVTGSVPSRISSKVTSTSLVKGTQMAKHTYFSPNWKHPPYQHSHAHQPPIYKRYEISNFINLISSA